MMQPYVPDGWGPDRRRSGPHPNEFQQMITVAKAAFREGSRLGADSHLDLAHDADVTVDAHAQQRDRKRAIVVGTGIFVDPLRQAGFDFRRAMLNLRGITHRSVMPSTIGSYKLDMLRLVSAGLTLAVFFLKSRIHAFDNHKQRQKEMSVNEDG